MATTRKSGKAKKAAAKRPATKKTAARRRAPSDAPPPPPDLHPRLREQLTSSGPVVPSNFHAMYDSGFRSSRGLARAVAAPRATAGHRRLARGVQGLEVTYDETTQVPNLVINQRPGAQISRRAGDSAESAAVDFIRRQASVWNLSADDAGTIDVVSVSATAVPSQPAPARARGARARAARAAAPEFDLSNLRTVNLIQRIDGKEVFNSDVTAAVNANNEVVGVAGQFFAGASSNATRSRSRSAAAAPQLASDAEAIARAAFDLTNLPYVAADFEPADETDSGAYRIYNFKPSRRDTRPQFERPVRLKDVMFPLGEGQFVPAYYIELWINGYPAFSYVMDALDTPDLLYRKNLTSHAAFKYRVHNTGDAIFRPEDGPAPGTPHKSGKPDGKQAPTIAEKMVTIESLLPGNPWLPPNAKTTDGNNCIAYADLKAPNGFGVGDVMGKVTSPGTFDYTYDHKKSARDATNLQNSLVGMFFHVNWLHDRWYEAGFDEASGNAQKDNFGRGGIGGDPVLAEGNDFSGTDNANMSTPADGASPRMQMFEFVGPAPLPSRTSNHEALITFHECGHYITNRLVGNANGLTNQQGAAMGEGWGDFFAVCMTSQKNDNFKTGVFAAGGWTDITTSFKDNYYFSIRRYPYSADMTKNPLTFKHISNNVVLPAGPPINAGPAGNNEVHNAGEVWCTMLWEVFVNLVAKLGHEVAEKRMLAYVIGGLKLTPPRPTFVQARDGILTAVSTIAAADLPEVKAGFAKRGIGKGAVAPPSPSTSLVGVVESFTP